MSNSVIDVSQWSRDHYNHIHPTWWGILFLIVIEVMVVGGFITSYFYLWILNTSEFHLSWPPGHTELPPLIYPSINTALVILCSISMYYGGILMEQGRRWPFVGTLVFCCGAGGVALFLRWLQFKSLPFTWKDNAYASFVWVLTGFHFLHLSSAVIGTALIGWFAMKGYYTRQRRLGVQVDTMYWYFVSVAWIPMYLVLYWAPRWF